MDILDHFWGPQTASSPKVTIYLPLAPRTLLRTCSKPCYFDPILIILDPFEGPGGGCARPCELPLGWRTCLDLSNPCPGPQILVILTTFPIEKSILSFAYQGQWKCHFDPILTPFEPSWAQTFGPAKCAYLGPLPWWTLRTLEGP